jgi:hypothetical protein
LEYIYAFLRVCRKKPGTGEGPKTSFVAVIWLLIPAKKARGADKAGAARNA